MAKSDPRCVRLNEEVVELIEQQVGENFTQKLETLVYNCYWALPEKKKELAKIEHQIKERNKHLNTLYMLWRKYKEMADSVSYNLNGLYATLERLVEKET